MPSGLASKNRGRLAPPPGLGCTCGVGSGGLEPQLGAQPDMLASCYLSTVSPHFPLRCDGVTLSAAFLVGVDGPARVHRYPVLTIIGPWCMQTLKEGHALVTGLHALWAVEIQLIDRKDTPIAPGA